MLGALTEPQLSGGRRALWAIAPIAVIALTIGALRVGGALMHQADLPDNFSTRSQGNFEVFYPEERGDDADQIVRDGAAFLRAAPSAWGDRLGGLEPPPGKVRLTLFRDGAELTRFASDTLKEDLSQNGGYFDTATLEIALVLSKRRDDNSLGIHHELAHMLIQRGGGRFGSKMPPWLSEGLAVWMETANPAKPDGPAPVSMWVKMVCVATGTPTLNQLTATDSGAFTSSGNEVAYAYSNLLVHFLLEQRASDFWVYARRTRSDEPANSDALLRGLEDDWQAWVEKRRAGFALALGEAMDRGGPIPAY